MPVIQSIKTFALTAEGEKNIQTDLLNLRLTNSKVRRLSLKEVIQPHLPIGLPCYDFIPVIGLTLGTSLLAVRSVTSGKTNSHDVTGGVYKARERIHGVVADTPLLAIPTSCSRVADYNLNWDRLFRICFTLRLRCLLYRPL